MRGLFHLCFFHTHSFQSDSPFLVVSRTIFGHYITCSHPYAYLPNGVTLYLGVDKQLATGPKACNDEKDKQNENGGGVFVDSLEYAKGIDREARYSEVIN